MGKHGKTRIIEERIQWLYNKHGRVSAELVVADAIKTNSPLHNNAGFNWDVNKAAYDNWLDHARKLIASVVIVHRTTKQTFTAPVYVRDPRKPANQQGYVSVQDCIKDPSLARDAIELEIVQCFARLERLRDLAKAIGQEQRVERAFQELKQLQLSLAA